MNSAIELVIFDMAGTTVEDNDEVLAAFMSAVNEHGLDASEEEVNARMGGSKVEVFRYFVGRQYGAGNEKRVDAVYSSFKGALEQGYQKNGVKAIAGVEDTFDELTRRGIKIATTTGFYRKVTEVILNSLGWDEKVLDVSICADDVPMGRPAPYMIFKAMEAAGVQDVNKVIKLGDTPFDMLAGCRAGLRGVVGVLSGSHTALSLGSVKHTHIIKSAADLPALLDKEFVK